MPSHGYTVPPGLVVTVLAGGRLRLLSHCLGDETPATGEPALVLDLVSSIDRRAVPAEREQTVRGVYKALPWTCRVSPRAEGGWTLAFRSPLYREYLALHIALLPALRRMLLDRAVAMTIGAAFARDGDATVIAGRTGHGKTSLLLGAIERGATLIGDEYIGLHENGEVTPIIRSLALRHATLAFAPHALERLSARRKASLLVARAATFVTRGFLQPLVHVPPGELIDHTPAGVGRARHLFWLKAGDTLRCEAMPSGEAAEQLATLQTLHDVAYGDLGAFVGNAPYPERWRDIAARALDGVACYRLSLPSRGGIPVEALDYVLEPDR